MSKNLGKLTSYNDKTMFGDFYLTTDNKNFENLKNAFNLGCLKNKPTCLKSENLPCMGSILTNKKELI